MTLLQLLPFSILAVFSAIFGAWFASFINVVAWRVPRGESVVAPPSHCPGCGHRLGWMDLIPIFSYVFLRGRCRYCGAPVAARYTVVELLGAALGGALFLICGLTLRLIPAAAASFALLTGLAVELHGPEKVKTRGSRLRVSLWSLGLIGLVLSLWIGR